MGHWAFVAYILETVRSVYGLIYKHEDSIFSADGVCVSGLGTLAVALLPIDTLSDLDDMKLTQVFVAAAVYH